MTKYGTHASKFVSPNLLLALHKQGMSERAIAQYLCMQHIHISKTAVHNRLKVLCSKFPTVRRFAKQRRMKILANVRPGWLKFVISCRQNRSTAAIKKALGIRCTTRTLRNFLHCHKNLRLLRPCKRPSLNLNQRRRRCQWAKAYLNKDINWTEAFFGDEKLFTLDGPGWRPRMWTFREENRPVLLRRGRHTSGVFYYGCFSERCAPPLVRLHARTNSVEYCRALSQSLRPGCVYFHDLWTVHTSAYTADFCKQRHFSVHCFPPCACDINPIENLWGIVSSRVYCEDKTYADTQSLANAVETAWASVQEDKALRANLARSVPSRLCTVALCEGKVSSS